MNPPTESRNTADVVLQLRSVTRRIEVFFEHQMKRLQSAMKELQAMQSEYDVARRLSADLETRREEWMRTRDLEIARLTTANETLANSWQELEQKQRDLEIQARIQTHTNAASAMQSSPDVPLSGQTDQSLSAESGPAETMDAIQMKLLQAQVNQHKKRTRQGNNFSDRT